MAGPPEATDRHPVIIIGGGPVGLSASILLSLRGIPHALFERHPGTSIHPKACGINQRTTEIFRAMGGGLADAVRTAAAPDDVKGRTAWWTALGPGGREIFSRDAWGGGAYADEYAAHGPTRYEVLPQIRLEPLLVRRARELNPAALRFGVEVTDLVVDEADGGGVRVKVRSSGGEESEVLARFVIAADGGRSVTDKLGVAWIGERDVMDMVSVHFRSPLRSRHPDPRNFITWFTHPDQGGSVRTGYLYQIGPWPFDSPEARDSEEWVFACAPTASDPSKFDEEAMIARLRNTLKIPDLPIEVISLSHWNVHSISAERYRVGPVFLIGDAAHRIPPWGALGMNTGIQDVQNLVWKLELALKDPARYEGLLESYDIERRPIGRRVGLSSLHNLRSHGLVMDAALGMSADQSPEENAAAIAPFFDKASPEHAAKVAAVARAQKILNLEFKAPGAEIGWFYPSVDADGEGVRDNHGGQLLGNGELMTEFFKPSTIPGHHIPHLWVSKAGQTVAIRDLIPLNKFLLLADISSAWEFLESDLVHVELVGENGWTDASGEWKGFIGAKAAILVRPDGIIAWRGSWDQGLAEKWSGVLGRALYATS